MSLLTNNLTQQCPTTTVWIGLLGSKTLAHSIMKLDPREKWRDGSVCKSNCYFLKLPGFDAQNPQGASQPSLTTFQGGYNTF